MPSSSEDEPQSKRKKGVVNKSKYKKEIMKTARIHGREYKNTVGNVVAAKTTGPDCNCRDKCSSKFNPEEKSDLIIFLYSKETKNEKDKYLMGLIERSDVARKSAAEGSAKKKENTFSYFAMKGDEKIPVCKKASLSLYAVTNKEAFRLTTLVAKRQSPNDMRGKHDNRGNLLPADVVAKIDGHIQEFPKKTAHYTTRQVTYLDSTLTVKKMHELFLEKYPNLNGTVKYEYYLRHYRQNYGYRFGRPQVDVCSTCEELNTKIKSPFLNENAKRHAVAELLVHKRRANKFFSKINEVITTCKEDDSVAGLVFDYMQNLPLPFMPVTDMFYLRKLWHYVFCIHNVANNESVFYTYHEGNGNKGPDEVCSFISHYIEHFLPNEVTKLHVFSDACGGQNRNHTLTRLLMGFTITGRFDYIEQYYPIRGHSFLPCDRNFTVIKRQVKRYDRVYLPQQYDDMIAQSRKSGEPFKVYSVKNEDILNFKEWWPKYFRKTSTSVADKKVKFFISKYKHLTYISNNKGYVEVREYISGLKTDIFKLLKGKSEDMKFPDEKSYDGQVGIKSAKIADLRRVIRYVPEQYKLFYNNILAWKTHENVNEEDSE